MKYLWILLLFALFIQVSCKKYKNNGTLGQPEVSSRETAYTAYGEEMREDNALTAGEMESQFEGLKVGDTLEVKLRSTVNQVCKNKGCWMKLDLPEEEDVMVKFKNYGFFVPKDIENKEVIVNGKAFVTEVSVEEQQHYAEDNGDSPEEIAVITKPKRTLSFLAEGVLIKK